MKLTKEQKKELSKKMGGDLKEKSQLYFTQFQGLKFGELADLRRRLKPLGCRYKVVKNSLIEHALREAGVSGAAEGLLSGPIGLVAGEGTDPIAAAKVLAAFAKEFPPLKVKAAFIEGGWLSSADCARLSSLGTRPELLSALAGTLYSAVAQAASVLQAPLRDFALVIKAVQEKKSGEPSAAAA